MTAASLRHLDRKQEEHGDRGTDDERVDDEFQQVSHDGPPEHRQAYSGRNVWSWRVAFFPSSETAHAHEMDDWESGSQIDCLPPHQ